MKLPTIYGDFFLVLFDRKQKTECPVAAVRAAENAHGSFNFGAFELLLLFLALHGGARHSCHTGRCHCSRSGGKPESQAAKESMHRKQALGLRVHLPGILMFILF